MDKQYGGGQIAGYGGQPITEGRNIPGLAPASVSPVVVEVERLEKLGHALHAAIETLEGRLSPVLRPSMPPEGRGGTPEAPLAVPLAQALANVRGHIGYASARLDALLQRIEL